MGATFLKTPDPTMPLTTNKMAGRNSIVRESLFMSIIWLFEEMAERIIYEIVIIRINLVSVVSGSQTRHNS
ncbi:hypothetical protein GCM10028808_51760 [Spirosoma migulaei]